MVDYIEKIQHQGQTSQNIDSPSFHGNWVHNPLCLGWPIRMDSGVRYTYSLEDYLPNDGHNYEIMVYFYVNTNTAQHSTQYCWVTSGGKDGNYWINTRVGGVVTRVANYTDSDCSWTSVPILSNNRYVSFWQDVTLIAVKRIANNLMYRFIVDYIYCAGTAICRLTVLEQPVLSVICIENVFVEPTNALKGPNAVVKLNITLSLPITSSG